MKVAKPRTNYSPAKASQLTVYLPLQQFQFWYKTTNFSTMLR
jgi:hypothetical protein